jgi:DNA-binding IclR family transcriptional regulator
MDSLSGVGVIDKSVAILSALAEGGPLTLGGLVAATGFSRPTTHRLASALEAHRLVRRDEGGRWALGMRLAAWGSAAAGGGLVEAARPVLERLRDATGESAQLFVREGDRRVCVASLDRPSGLRNTVPVGAALPLDRGSGGKVLLAWSADAAGFPDVDLGELAAIRARGWGASIAEREPGVASVSASVLDEAGRPLASVSVSGPVDRLGSDPGPRYGPSVAEAAREIERRTGSAGGGSDGSARQRVLLGNPLPPSVPFEGSSSPGTTKR